MKKFSFLFFLLVFVGCNNKQIQFDNSEPLALVPSLNWAVVVEPYVGFRTQMSWDSEISEHCRKGEILLVKGKSYSSEGEIWYSFEQGWLHDSFVQIYNNKYKAFAVVENMKINQEKK